ncbi:MAG: restriction endonuclease subunit S [Candidatus Paceibacterota bacterium]
MKTNWLKVKFELSIKKTVQPKGIKQKFFQSQGAFPVIDQSAEYIAGYTDDDKQLFKGNLPVIIFGDHTRVIKFVDFQFVLGADGTKVITPNDDFNAKYFYYYLLSVDLKSRGYNRHYKLLRELLIPCPPKPIQRKIVRVLDGVRGEIGKQGEIVEKGKEMKKALMKKLFSEGVLGERLRETEIGKMPVSWLVVQLGEVTKINPRNDIVLENNEKVGFVTMADVSNDGYIKNIQERLYKDVKNGFTKFQDGDYLFAKITPCMENGKGGLYRSERLKYAFGSTEFHIVRPAKEILSEFIGYLVNIGKFRKTAAENMSGACGQKRVPKDFLNNYKFGLPSVGEQKEIVAILRRLDERIGAAQGRKRLYEELFEVMLNKLMAGEVSVDAV